MEQLNRSKVYLNIDTVTTSQTSNRLSLPLNYRISNRNNFFFSIAYLIFRDYIANSFNESKYTNPILTEKYEKIPFDKYERFKGGNNILFSAVGPQTPQAFILNKDQTKKPDNENIVVKISILNELIENIFFCNN